VVVEEESNNQGRRTGYRGSILDHIVNRNRKEGALRLYNDYFAENPKLLKVNFEEDLG